MIFVTGGTGLTGARLLYDLALQKKEVTALKRSNSSMAIFNHYFANRPDLQKYIQWKEGDVTDAATLSFEKGSEVFHCAGMVSFDPDDRDELYRVNIKGTENVVNRCLDAGVRKLVHVSSVAALGRNLPGNIYITEESHWENDICNSDYAISKYGGEREVFRGIAEGLSAVVVSPTVILGPGNYARGSMQLISRVDNGLRFYTDGVSGYIDVRDVSEVMIRLMNSEITGEKFLLNSENMGYKEFFTIISNALNKKPPHIRASRWMGQLLWRWEWLRKKWKGHHPLVTRYSAATAFKSHYYSNEKITGLLNYNFIPVERMIADAVYEYLNSGNELKN